MTLRPRVSVSCLCGSDTDSELMFFQCCWDMNPFVGRGRGGTERGVGERERERERLTLSNLFIAVCVSILLNHFFARKPVRTVWCIMTANSSPN